MPEVSYDGVVRMIDRSELAACADIVLAETAIVSTRKRARRRETWLGGQYRLPGDIRP